MTVGEVQLRRVDLALVGLHRSLVLGDQRLLRGELLLGDRVLCEERLIALEIYVRVCEQRRVADQGPLGLLERYLVGPRVDLDERVAVLDLLALLEGDVLDLSADLALHRHRGERRHGAQANERNGHVARAGGGGHHRHRAALSETAASGRGGGLGGQEPREQRERQQHADDDQRSARGDVFPPGVVGLRLKSCSDRAGQIAVFVIHE